MAKLAGGEGPCTVLRRQASATNLGEVWPDVDARLRTLLAARGAADVDDIVQEVAIRVIERDVGFTDAADLYPWAAVVARNLHVSQLRERARVVAVDAVPAQPAAEDVAESVHWRGVWIAALTHISQMSPKDQDALLGPVTQPNCDPTSAEPGCLSVRRHRARAALRRRLRDVLSGLAPVGVCWRLLRRQPAGLALSASLSAALLIVAAGLGYPAPKALGAAHPFGNATVYKPADKVAKIPVRTTVVSPWSRATGVRALDRPTPGRHLVLQPSRGPGLRVDESRPAGPRPLLCLHGPLVEGTCSPSVLPPPIGSDRALA
jgi:hypothetical protein